MSRIVRAASAACVSLCLFGVASAQDAPPTVDLGQLAKPGTDLLPAAKAKGAVSLDGKSLALNPGQTLKFGWAGNQIYNIATLTGSPTSLVTVTTRVVKPMVPGELGDSTVYEGSVTLSKDAKQGDAISLEAHADYQSRNDPVWNFTVGIETDIQKKPIESSDVTLVIQGVEPKVTKQSVSVAGDGSATFTDATGAAHTSKLSASQQKSLSSALKKAVAADLPSKMPGNPPFPGASSFTLTTQSGSTEGFVGADKDSSLGAAQKKQWAALSPLLAKLEALMKAPPAAADGTLTGTLERHTEGTGLGDPPHEVYTLTTDQGGTPKVYTVDVKADGLELLRNLGADVGKTVQLKGAVNGDTISISKPGSVEVVAASPRTTPGLSGAVDEVDKR